MSDHNQNELKPISDEAAKKILAEFPSIKWSPEGWTAKVSPIIQSAITKALKRAEISVPDGKEERGVFANIHVEHYFPKGYDPDAEPWKSISRYCADLLRIKEALPEPVNLSGQMELNEKVARLCGLNPITIPFVPNKVRPGHNGDWFTPEAAKYMRETYPRGAAPKVIPDYCNDLNACYEFEKMLSTKEQQADYARLLVQVLNDDLRGTPRFIGPSSFDQIHATAEQRCRAFIAVMEASA